MADHYIYYLEKKILINDGRTLYIGRDDSSEIFLEERTVSRQHAAIRRDGDTLYVKDFGSTNGTKLNYKALSHDEMILSHEDRITIGPFVIVYRNIEESSACVDHKIDCQGDIYSETLVMESKIASILNNIQDPHVRNELYELKHIINQSKEKLSKMANIDRLTLLYNRRYFDEALAREFERAKRYSPQLCLLMLDIDFFKKVNDEHGHQKGDQVLTEIAAIISENIRLNDMVARYGGEEMVLILPETSPASAELVANKLRRVIELSSVVRTGLTITVSIGGSQFNSGDKEASSLIARADEALYQAKNSGRNCVVFT